MQEPFDVLVGDTTYAVFPEEENTYTIFKDGKEYARLQRDTDQQWSKLDLETDLPVFKEDKEIEYIGQAIDDYKEEDDDE
jgi:hypothetical protein